MKPPARVALVIIAVLQVAACGGDGASTTSSSDADLDTASSPPEVVPPDAAVYDAPAPADLDTSSSPLEVVPLDVPVYDGPAPAGVDTKAPIGGLSGSDCYALCEWLMTDPLGTAVASGCHDLDSCLDLCGSVVLEAVAGDCQPTIGDLLGCQLALSASGCSAKDALFGVPACDRISACFVEDPSTPFTEASFNTHRVLCAQLARRLAGCEAPPLDADTCLMALQSHSCACTWGGGASAETCALTAADLQACVAATSSCSLPDHPSCAPLELAVPESVAPVTELASLDCAAIRRFCVDAFPEQGLRLDHPACGSDNGGYTSVYWDPVETCVATTGALQCRCALSAGGPGCDHTVADATTCFDASYINGCPYLGGGDCLAPPTWSSGLPAGTVVATAPRETLEDWCAWRVCFSGGPGYVPVGCNHNIIPATVPTVDECVDDLATVFESCDQVTLGDLDACIVDSLVHDACHRVGRFISCAISGEAEACHLLLAIKADCPTVRACLEDVWDVVIALPGDGR